ncbi:MAG: glycosyltransferase family 4 protein [Thermodesulfobacteriota bacterium]
MSEETSVTSDCMRIGFYRYSLHNRGGDRMVVDYANYLAAADHRVTFYLKEMTTVFTVDPRIEITHVPCRGRLGFLLYPLFRCFGQDLMIVDIIHLVPVLRLKNRIVYFAQADDVEYYDSPLARKIIDAVYRWYYSRKEPIITVSRYLADVFSRRYGFDNSLVVTNGIDLAKFFPDPDPDLMRMKEKRKAMLFMARGDHFRKGYDLAVEVFSRLSRDDGQNLELWVCGQEIPENQYSFPVRNFGVVDDSRLRQLLSSADIFFYPSRHEGFGLFPLEAMACGCVSVITEAIPYAGFSECLQVAPVGDVEAMHRLIVALLQDHDRLAALHEKTKNDASCFDLQKSKELFCQTLEKIYREGRP